MHSVVLLLGGRICECELGIDGQQSTCRCLAREGALELATVADGCETAEDRDGEENKQTPPHEIGERENRNHTHKHKL